jgi:putative PIN family toxin of toxin-antitoxin system
MLRLFLDTTILYAAVRSSTGASRELLRLALENQVLLNVSEDILVEAQRNILEDIPDYYATYHALLTALDMEVLPSPPLKLVRQVEEYIVAKDAPIVAAAIRAHADYLVTLDKKHILKPSVAEKSGLRIVRPDVALQAVRASQHQGKAA